MHKTYITKKEINQYFDQQSELKKVLISGSYLLLAVFISLILLVLGVQQIIKISGLAKILLALILMITCVSFMKKFYDYKKLHGK